MFKDYFSNNSSHYGQYRPQYPKKLFYYLASISPKKEKAWDCACGTGQSALGLLPYFREVIATDASKSQINKAIKNPGINYQVSTAEKTFIGNQEVDIITVAQALHWFKIEDFFKEADRVLRNNGILSVWTYNLLQINQKTDQVINQLYKEILMPYWPKERRMVENSYKNIAFPYQLVESPSFEMEAIWNLEQLLGYLETWSAIKQYRKNNNSNKLNGIYENIRSLWGSPNKKQLITWPLTTMIMKKE